MTNSQRLAIARQALTAWLGRKDGNGAPKFQESMLIRDGFFCGRRFRSSTVEAVWFIEQDQMKIYAADTMELLETLDQAEVASLAESLSDSGATDSSPAEIRRAA